LRGPAARKAFLELLAVTSAGPALVSMSVEQAQALAVLFSGSLALSNLLVANPAWLAALDIEHIRHARRKQGLAREAASGLKALLPAQDYAAAYRRLRQFKQQQMLRIA